MSMRVIEFDANGPPSEDGRSIFTSIPKIIQRHHPLKVGDRVVATQETEGWWATIVAIKELIHSDHIGIYLRPDYLTEKEPKPIICEDCGQVGHSRIHYDRT